MKAEWSMAGSDLLLELNGRVVGKLWLSGGPERYAHFTMDGECLKIHATTQPGAKREAMRLAAQRYRRKAAQLCSWAEALDKLRVRS